MSARALVLAAALLAPAAACRPASQEMARQQRYEEYEPSTFFDDGGSARHLPLGVVPRAAAHDGRAPRLADLDAAEDSGATAGAALFARGRERYAIWCSPCHDLAGSGDGPIVQRGYPRPAAFAEERLRAASDAQLYRVITHGLGKMPPYGPHVPPDDRRAIVAWIRVLQRSQHGRLEDVPPALREELLAERGEERR